MAFDRVWMVVTEQHGRFVSQARSLCCVPCAGTFLGWLLETLLPLCRPCEQRQKPKMALIEQILPPEALTAGWCV